MDPEAKTYLSDIQQAAKRINGFAAGATFDEYSADWKASKLVEWLFYLNVKRRKDVFKGNYMANYPNSL